MRTVAYLGPENTNTHAAARKQFGARARYAHAPTVEEVFHAVERDEADFGVVPIENTLGGAVTHTLDRFVDFKDSPVKIHGEIELPIRHFLFYPKGAALHSIATVYSHPQALAQCHKWLSRTLPAAMLVETSSTAMAVEKLLQRPFDESRKALSAAIGPRELNSKPELDAVEIPQDRENVTRFLVMGKGHCKRGAVNKTAVMFALQDRPGALYDALTPFKKHGINLTKIESHPDKRKAWEYIFFIDLQGHLEDPPVAKALAALEKRTALFRVLGSYPVRNKSGAARGSKAERHG